MKFRHKKRGSEYTLDDILEYNKSAVEGELLEIECAGDIEFFEFQCSGLFEGGLIVLYYNSKDGSFWARPAREFFDGRFERA